MKQKLATAFLGFILLLLWLELSKYTVYSLVIPAFFLGFISYNSYIYAKAKKYALESVTLMKTRGYTFFGHVKG